MALQLITQEPGALQSSTLQSSALQSSTLHSHHFKVVLGYVTKFYVLQCECTYVQLLRENGKISIKIQCICKAVNKMFEKKKNHDFWVKTQQLYQNSLW